MTKKKQEEDFSGRSLSYLLWRMSAIDYVLRYPDHGLSLRQLRELDEMKHKLSAAAAPHLARIRLDLPIETTTQPGVPTEDADHNRQDAPNEAAKNEPG